MTERPVTHVDELLQELLDDRLSAGERAAVEAHLEGCPRCQRLRRSLLAGRQLLREAPSEPVSAALIDSVRSAIAAEAVARPAATAPAEGRRSARRWPVAAGIAAMLLVALAVGLRWRMAPLDSVGDLTTLHATASPLFAERDPAALEARLGDALPFRARVLDLAMMDVRLVGGRADRVGRSPAAVMIYETRDEARVLCVMWRGRLVDLPPTDDSRDRPPFTFRVYRRGGLTVVAWQEGELVCAMVAGGDPEGVVAMAMGKAMLPARGAQSG